MKSKRLLTIAVCAFSFALSSGIGNAAYEEKKPSQPRNECYLDCHDMFHKLYHDCVKVRDTSDKFLCHANLKTLHKMCNDFCGKWVKE